MAGFVTRLRPPPLILWMSLCGLLLLGILSTAVDFAHVSTVEMRRANAGAQRAVIDPSSGNVSLGDGDTEPAFDVSSENPTEKKEAAVAENPAITPAPNATPETPVRADMQDMPALRTEPLKSALPTVQVSNDSLVTAPAPEITEGKGPGALPKKAANGMMPATIYAQHFPHKSKEALLTLVVLNAGFSPQTDGMILSLPKTVTVAFSPYGQDVTASISTFRRAGFEAWAMLPVMGEHFPQDDPGPLGLVASLPKDELLRRLHEAMAQTIGTVGFVLPPDDALGTKAPIFGAILSEIAERGLYLLSTHPSHAPKDITKDTQLQAIMQRADMVLDPVPDEGQIQSKLASIPAALKKKGSLIVVLTARPQTLLLLQHWLLQSPLAAPAALAPLSAQWAPVKAPVVEEKKEGDAAAEKSDEKDAKKPDAEKAAEPEKPAADAAEKPAEKAPEKKAEGK